MENIFDFMKMRAESVLTRVVETTATMDFGADEVDQDQSEPVERNE